MMALLSIALAYLLGGIPFGLILVRLMTGRDVRQEGSGNIGATNVLRTTGRLAGVLTLILDAGKAWLAVWIAGRLSGGSALWMSAAALAVLLGHVFSIWLKFRGGKGVACFSARSRISLRFRSLPWLCCSASWWGGRAIFRSAASSRRGCFQSPAG